MKMALFYFLEPVLTIKKKCQVFISGRTIGILTNTDQYFPKRRKSAGRYHKIGHSKCTKGATFNDKMHFSFTIKQLEQAN